MIAVDTNILVRWVLRDDARQAELADQVLAEPVAIGPSVLVELGWVLLSVGGMTRAQLAKMIELLLGLPTVFVANAAQVRWAVERFRQKGDWADLIHQATAGDVEAIATFDGKFANAGQGGEVPVKLVKA